MTHAEARKIIQQAWQRVHGRMPSEAETAYTQAIALLETGYGRVGQFAAMAAQGQYNWGALERARSADGTCPTGTSPGKDSANSVCFYVFPSDVEAAAAFIRNLTKRHWPVIQAMKGSAHDVATAMRVRPAYYTGPSGSEDYKIQAYANSIESELRAIGVNLPSAATLKSTTPWVLLAAAAGVAYWYGHTHGFPRWFPRALRY